MTNMNRANQRLLIQPSYEMPSAPRIARPCHATPRSFVHLSAKPSQVGEALQCLAVKSKAKIFIRSFASRTAKNNLAMWRYVLQRVALRTKAKTFIRSFVVSVERSTALLGVVLRCTPLTCEAKKVLLKHRADKLCKTLLTEAKNFFCSLPSLEQHREPEPCGCAAISSDAKMILSIASLCNVQIANRTQAKTICRFRSEPRYDQPIQPRLGLARRTRAKIIFPFTVAMPSPSAPCIAYLGAAKP